MSMLGLVVAEGNGSPAYKPNSRQEATLTPDGRLRVQSGNSVSGVNVITPGQPFSGGSSLGYVATAMGTFTVTLNDGSVIPNIPLVVGSYQTLPFAATQVVLNSGAAIFYNGLSNT